MSAPWLKSMENGALGEARARAFLMERFWVLERSVDVEGADFLIQRRLTGQNFLDHDPPRLGVVQVKFIQDEATSISLAKTYVCGPKGNVYTEFFLLVFSGREDQQTSFLFSAQDIVRDFTEKSDGAKTTLTLSGGNLLRSTNQAIITKSAALNRIETALKNADFMANRMFLSQNNYVEVSPDHIDPDLALPMDSSNRFISRSFYEEKKQLQRTVADMEEVLEGMHQILRSTDPIDAYNLQKDFLHPHMNWEKKLIFSADFFNDSQVIHDVNTHRARLEQLRKLELLGTYVHLVKTYRSTVFDSIVAIGKRTGRIRVEALYDPKTLISSSITVSEVPDPQPSNCPVEPGHQVYLIDLGNVFRLGPRQVYQPDISKALERDRYAIETRFQSDLDVFVFGAAFLDQLS
jgi:hypothetical protein